MIVTDGVAAGWVMVVGDGLRVDASVEEEGRGWLIIGELMMVLAEVLTTGG